MYALLVGILTLYQALVIMKTAEFSFPQHNIEVHGDHLLWYL